MKTFKFSELFEAPLIVDAIYEGGSAGNVSDDPISKLLAGSGNQGGFRVAGTRGSKRWVVLYTSGEDADWPDALDALTGQFTYFGDNKKPGHPLHETAKGGNALLAEIFAKAESEISRQSVPPVFIFRKSPTAASARSVQFLGLAVPGTSSRSADDLVAIWRSIEGQRFQNYRATFTVLDVPEISKKWIEDLRNGTSYDYNSPNAWKKWQTNGTLTPLVAIPTSLTRTGAQQRPRNESEHALLKQIWDYFGSAKEGHRGAYAFEHFAAWVFSLTDARVVIDEVTRRSVDHGRDAVGHYKLGLETDPIIVEFALEAKCYDPGFDGGQANTVGVKETSRLISRLLHRQFGVLVTTSVVGEQAYNEIRQDRHPVILISGGDIARILTARGITDLKDKLKDFPLS